MATANWTAARQLQTHIPHTYTAMEHLTLAMSEANKNKGKTSLFGNDKGLKSYLKFEEKLKNALLAMTLDGVVERNDSAKVYYENLIEILDVWIEIFPNWSDAEAFAREKIRSNQVEARKLISTLIGVRI